MPSASFAQARSPWASHGPSAIACAHDAEGTADTPLPTLNLGLRERNTDGL